MSRKPPPSQPSDPEAGNRILARLKSELYRWLQGRTEDQKRQREALDAFRRGL